MPRDASITRERILNAAHLAFFRHGFGRVKMSDIARAAGLTKRTLYHHFDSKDALLGAMLEHQHELSTESYARIFRETEGGTEAFVGRLFGDLESWAESPRFLGSGFTRLANELCDLRGHPAVRLARMHKATLETLFAEGLKSRGADEPENLAREVWVMMEGAMLMALIHDGPGYVRVAHGAALKLVESTVEKKRR